MQIRLLKHQIDFIRNDSRFCLLKGGIGSGKSFAGAAYVLKKIGENPETVGFIGANTYRQLHSATLKTLFSLLDSCGIQFIYNQNKGIITINQSEIMVASLDNYEMLRGIEIGWFYIDETRDTKVEAFDVLVGRLRHNKSKSFEGRLSTSPSGYTWLYDKFVINDNPQYAMVEAITNDNIFLPDGYVDSLKDQYDDKMYKQEVLGQFVKTGSGTIYYAFDRDVNVKKMKLIPTQPIWIGMDFNVDPMTAVVCHLNNNHLFVVEEILLRNSNTTAMAKHILKKYGKCNIIADSTGSSLRTSSHGRTDHNILTTYGHNVVAFRNPFRVDRYNAINNGFEKEMVIVDESCKTLIKDLEQFSFKEGSAQPDTSNHLIGHISDALGYIYWYAFPLVKPSMPIMMIDR